MTGDEQAGSLHSMPFGAALEPGRGVRFALWAPGARRVELELTADDGSARYVAMTPSGDGWFSLTTAEAGAGTRYRYRIDGDLCVPDPASRAQPDGVHGPSQVVNPTAYRWRSQTMSRSWRETVLYELHIGTFTAGGTLDDAIARLDHLAETGITAVQVMPVATFAGERNWGYDGVLPFAPHRAYGGPEALRRFVDAAHGRGLAVILDVVYNHFGPEGNYLAAYAPSFFTDRYATPWGDAIDFESGPSRPVRDFFIHNALYWLTEFRLDGLRLDAVHAIVDRTRPHILDELADAVADGPGRQREIHLVLENERNEARYLAQASGGYRAQWNDDFHHAAHCVATGESDGYYADYAERPRTHLARCLAEGFAYQDDPSPFRDGARRGEPSDALPTTAFIDFLQNHDQVGNRARGERLTTLAPADRLRALSAILLLAPAVPALFMGEEYGAAQPFQFFAGFEGELADAVRTGRRREFGSFSGFGGPAVPDPMALETLAASRLDWTDLDRPEHARCLARVRELLAIRHRKIVPRLPGRDGRAAIFADTGLDVRWRLSDASELRLTANLGDAPIASPDDTRPPEPASAIDTLWAEPAAGADGLLPPWSVVVTRADRTG